MSVRRLFRVEGRVQGVWFRASTRDEAVRRGIHGYAVNLPDGSVEVLACGDGPAVDELAAWLAHGPPMATVDRVVTTDVAGDCPEGFSTGWSGRTG